jgi:hypothetical protein
LSAAAPHSPIAPAIQHHDGRNALICGLLVACAVLVSLPFAELGRNDDWTYAWSALQLARSGKLTFNGWSTAMLGAQAFWGAGVIRLFGFSFSALRLSVLPFTCGTASMLYLIARRLGASTALAAMAALTMGLSQIAIECAATFSTDLPALFCFTFTLHQIERSLDPKRRSPSQILFPLLLAAVVGYAGGSIRQVYWLMPLLGLSYAAWVRRGEHANAVLTLSLLAAVIAAVLETEAWSHAQPYFIPEYFHAMAVVFFAGFPRSLVPGVAMAMTLVLFALPMIVGIWPALKQPGSLIVETAGVVLGVVFVFWLGNAALAPCLGSMVSEYGMMYPGQEQIGNLPQIIPDWLRLLLTLGCCLAAARMLWAMVRLTPTLARRIAAGTVPHSLCMTALFAVPYVALVIFRGPAFVLSDRYTLPLTATLCLWLAWLSTMRGGRQPTAAGWALLVIVALFAIAVVHDEFAGVRARLRATAELTDHGVPRTSITAGVDYDAWTQLLEVGHVNDARVLNPPNSFVPHPRSVPQGRTDFWFWEWSPAVRPDYFIVNSPQSDLQSPAGLTIPYHAWLPPFDRAVYVQKRPPGSVVNR